RGRAVGRGRGDGTGYRAVRRAIGATGDTPGRGGPMPPSERTELLERYRSGAAAVDDALAGISDAELDRRPPGEGEWTAREIAHHLADSEAMGYIRLRRLLADAHHTSP